MVNKKTFLMEISTLQNYFPLLSDAQLGALLRRIVNFICSGSDTCTGDKLQDTAFAVIREKLEENDAKYEKALLRTRKKSARIYAHNADASARTVSVNCYTVSDIGSNFFKKNSSDKRDSLCAQEENFFNEVRQYAEARQQETGIAVNVDYFLEYYSANNWTSRYGEPLKSWKLAYLSWENREIEREKEKNCAKKEKARPTKNDTAAAYEEIKNELNAQFFDVSATNAMRVVK